MFENNDLIIFWAVVLSRFFVPLLIPRFPIIGVVLSLLIDGVDQTIFQKYTTLNLDSYQSYDKALDIYYLTIAYLSTFKNWTNLYAIKVARFLWYYRLVGVTLFELTYSGVGPRWLLFIFPNTFEYFFIFYEIVALKWDPAKLTKKAILSAVAFIWVFIKLPQEYWIHIAQNDTTDFLKENVFHVPLDAGLSEILQANMWLIPATIGAIVGVYLLIKYIYKKLPTKDWNLRVSHPVLQVPEEFKIAKLGNGIRSVLNNSLVEKITLITLVTIIFAEMLPSTNATIGQLLYAVAVVVSINALLSHGLNIKGISWQSAFKEFLVMGMFNLAIFAAFEALSTRINVSLASTTVILFMALLTLIVTLFDRFRPIYEYRFKDQLRT